MRLPYNNRGFSAADFSGFAPSTATAAARRGKHFLHGEDCTPCNFRLRLTGEAVRDVNRYSSSGIPTTHHP